MATLIFARKIQGYSIGRSLLQLGDTLDALNPSN